MSTTMLRILVFLALMVGLGIVCLIMIFAPVLFPILITIAAIAWITNTIVDNIEYNRERKNSRRNGWR